MSTSVTSVADGPDQSVSGVAQSEHPVPPSQAQLENSQSAIRDTTKWMVAVAGAVGAVVVAGLQLSHLPNGTEATVLAIIGFVIALLGVAVVVFFAARVLSIRYTTFGQLAKLNKKEEERTLLENRWSSKEEKPTRIIESESNFLMRTTARVWLFVISQLHAWRMRLFERDLIEVNNMIVYLQTDILILSNFLAGSIAELQRRIRATDKEILRIRGETPAQGEHLEEAPAVPPATAVPPAAGVPTAAGEPPAALSPKADLAEIEWRAGQLETAAGQLIAFANQRVIERKFGALRHAVQFGGIAVLVGVALFALAPKKAQPTSLTVVAPTRVTVMVKTPSTFGPACTVTQLNGIAIGGTWDEPIVITEATKDCQETKLVLRSDIGFAVPAIAASPSSSR